jgi:PKD repeat protein
LNRYEHISRDDGGCVAGSVFVPEGLWPSQFKFLFIDFVFLKVYNLELDKTERACFECNPPIPPTRNETFYRSFQREGENVNEARMTTMWFGPYKDETALYISKFGNKETIVRIRYTGSTNKPPNPLFDFSYETGTQVQFDASRSFDPEDDSLTYQWDFGDGSDRSTGEQTVHEYTASGEYTVTLMVSDSQGQSQQEFKTVTIGQVPSVKIVSPLERDTFFVGEILMLKGEAFDALGISIPDDQLEWEVRQHHAGKSIVHGSRSYNFVYAHTTFAKDHFHPFLDARRGNNIELYPAPEPEDYLAATDSFLRVLLTATDANGLSRTISTDVQPSVVIINIHSEPEGRDVVVDEYNIQTPANITSWFNFNLPLHVVDQPPYLFKTWSDGNKDRNRTVSLLSNATQPTFTAIFCLDQDIICNAHEDCCSGHCDSNQCMPVPITQTPTVSPPSLSPADGSASLTAQPSVILVQPPELSVTGESPPLEIDVEKPLDPVEDGSIEFHGGTGSVNPVEGNNISNETIERKMATRNALVSITMILVVVIVFWWCRRHRLVDKESENGDVFVDSFYGGLSVEKDADDDPEMEDVEIDTMIRPHGTGSTDGSERSRSESSSSSTECRKNTGKQFENPIYPFARDIQLSPDEDSPSLSSLNEDIPKHDLESQDYLKGVPHMSVLHVECDSADKEEPVFSNTPFVDRYPVPCELLSQKQDDSLVEIANIEGIGCDERLRDNSFCLDQSSVSMNASNLEDLNVLASMEQSTFDRLSFMELPTSVLVSSIVEEATENFSSMVDSASTNPARVEEVGSEARYPRSKNASIESLNTQVESTPFKLNDRDTFEGEIVARDTQASGESVESSLLDGEDKDESAPTHSSNGSDVKLFFETAASIATEAPQAVGMNKSPFILNEMADQSLFQGDATSEIAVAVGKIDNVTPPRQQLTNPHTPSRHILFQPMAKILTGATMSPTPADKSVATSDEMVDGESFSPNVTAQRLMYNEVHDVSTWHLSKD